MTTNTGKNRRRSIKRFRKSAGCWPSLRFLSIWIALEQVQSLSPYHPLAFLGIAVTFYTLARSANRMESYALLAENEVHCRSLWFRLRRTFRRKLDNI